VVEDIRVADEEVAGGGHVPIPVPRRSTRERHPPKRFQDFVSHQMTVQADSKVNSILTLVESGVLNQCDKVMAQKLLKAVLE